MRFSLIVIFLSLSYAATAQTFKQGSVRLKGGQEQAGLIGQVRSGSPEGLEFKSDSEGEIQILYANEIEGYTVNNVFFSSYHQNLYRDNDWIFAEILAEGDLTLIRRNNMYFVRQKNRVEFKHLGSHYKTTLMKLTSACPIVSAKGVKIGLNNRPIVDFIKEYNECVASKKPNLQGMPRTVTVGFQLGYDYTQATFSFNSFMRFLSAEKQYDKSFLQGGVEFNFKHYRVSRFFGLYTGVLLNSNSYSAVNKSVFGNSSEVNEYSFSYKELRIPLGIEINAPSLKKLTYHLRGGAIFSHQLSFKSDRSYSEATSNNGATITYSEPMQMTAYKPKMMWGGALGLDYRISQSHIRLQAGWYAGGVTASSPTITVAGKINSFNIMTSYLF